MTTWTENIDMCTDALLEFYTAVSEGKSHIITVAINNLHTVGVRIMRMTPDWEKVFQTSQYIVMGKIPKMANFKLTYNLEKIREMKNSEITTIANELLKQQTQW